MIIKPTYILQLVLLLGWVSFSQGLDSQNLVPNGDFENYDKCPEKAADFNEYVSEWFTFFSTPDYMNKCDYYTNLAARNNSSGFTALKTFSVNSTPTPREYIHNKLKRPLKSGEVIYISYWIYQHNYGYLIDQWSFYFSKEPAEVYPDSGKLYIELPAQVNWNGGPILDTNKYVQLHGCFTAEGGEEYICFGNFIPPSEVGRDSMVPPGSSPQGNFIGLDDVQMISEEDIHYDSVELCESDTFHFIDYYDLGLYATYNGSRIDEGFFPGEHGSYTIDIHLPECGLIDSMEVIFKSCAECYSANYSDVSLCLLDSFYVNTHIDARFRVKVNGKELINTFNPGNPGNFKAVVFSDDCDSIDQFEIVFVDCYNCSPGFPDISGCPDEIPDLNGLLEEPFYVSGEIDKCPGEYKLPVYSNQCSVAVDTQTIIIQDYPNCYEYIVSDSICMDEEYSLPDISPLTYSFINEPPASFDDPGQYHYQIIDERCDQSVAYGSLDVLKCGNCNVYIPNTFTPNGDEINDVFKVSTDCEILKFSAYVFDRFGNLIIESRNEHEIWDGDNYTPGVYTYRIGLVVPGKDGPSEKLYHGTITLLE